MSEWFEEHRGTVMGFAVVGVLVALIAMYFTDILPEQAAGLLLGAAAVVGCFLFTVRALLEHASGRGARGAVIGVAIATVLVSGWLVYSTLEPGAPVVHGQLAAQGDSLSLGDEGHGRLRMLLHGKPAGAGAEEVEATLALGDKLVQGHISRSITHGRSRRGRSGTVVTEHDSEYVEIDVPDGASEITLRNLKGSLTGPLEVSLFRQPIPFLAEEIAAALVVLAAALIAARLRAGPNGVAAVGTAVVFGIGVYRYATPAQAVRPEIGSLIGGLVIGGIGGAVLAWVVRRAAGPGPAVKATAGGAARR